MINILTNLVAIPRNLAAGFFGFPTWYEYLPTNDAGDPSIENIMDFWLIAAAGIEMVVRVAGMLAIAYFIYSGFVFMTSQGNPERVGAGRKGMINATVGLVVALMSANLVSLIAGMFDDTGDTGSIDIPGVEADSGTMETVLKYIFAIVGAVSVLMVVIGGIRYIISAGNPQQAATAKNTIIYALVGLIIAVSAFVIVNFIFRAVEADPGASRAGTIAVITEEGGPL